MDAFISAEQIKALWGQINEWAITTVFVPTTGYQAAAIFGCFCLAYILARPVRAWFYRYIERIKASRPEHIVSEMGDEANDLVLPALWAFLTWCAGYVFRELETPDGLIRLITSLLTAWVIIRLATSLLKSPFWSRLVAITAWTIAALNIVGLLDKTRELLGSLAISLGDVRVSALSVVEGLISLAVLLWVANFATRVINQQVHESATLTPSMKVLISKLTKILGLGLAILLALAGAGIDLTALTVFSGALGIGIGFGLQKIVSNFISGIILLLDKSVKPGDNIVVGDTFGWIDKLNARYVSVITRDGTEHLIPNENLITEPVENWSYTNRLLRLRMPVGVSYDSDLHLAMKLCLEAADETDRIIQDPAPKCLLRGFGDNAVDLEIRAWIDDPQNGRGGVTSECLQKVWQKFHDNDIEFPFPQRDLHIRSMDGNLREVLLPPPPP